MKRLPAPPGAQEPTEEKAHVWEGGWSSDGSMSCKVCGVTLRPNVIMAGNSGLNYHYTDAFNKQISSLVPLSCPVFIGDTNGAVAEVKERSRKLKGQVTVVEGRVDSVEERLARLERENEALRAEVAAKTNIDVTALVNWLSEMVAQSAAMNQPSRTIEVQGQQYALPAPVVDLVVTLANERDVVAEYVPIEAKKGHDKG